MMKFFLKKNQKEISGVLFLILFLSVISMLLTILFHYPPSPNKDHIRCDYVPVFFVPQGIETDSDGNFYVYTTGATLCFDKDWNYRCSFASYMGGDAWFSIKNDCLIYQYARGCETYRYTLQGEFLSVFPSDPEKHPEMKMYITDKDGETYRICGGLFFPQIRRADQTIVWRGSFLGSLLKCLIVFSVLLNMINLFVSIYNSDGNNLLIRFYKFIQDARRI